MKLLIFTLFFIVHSTSLFAFDVEGKIKLDPPFPKPVEIEVTGDHVKTCGTKKISQRVLVSPEGFLANAVIELKGAANPGFQNQNEKYVLDQMHCEFSPHVLLIPKGSKLEIRNSESVVHNVRAFDESALMQFNLPSPIKGYLIKKQFDKAGHYIVRCGIHKWMHAQLIVQEHPFYALTNDSGYFKISGIPEGNYILKIWHESLGEKTIPVNSKTSNVLVTFNS